MIQVAAALLTIAPAPAPEPPAVRAKGDIAQYVTVSDYPAEALRANEQGLVAFELAVDAEGRVSGCTIWGTSGSKALDETTCRIMSERARFTPARDASGRAVPDKFFSRLNWRLPDEGGDETYSLDTREGTLVSMWFSCLMGESLRLVPSPKAAEEIATSALAACSGLETLVADEFATLAKTEPHVRHDVAGLRAGMEGELVKTVGRYRAALAKDGSGGGT